MLARLNRLVKGQYVLFLISDYVICLFHHSYFIDETFDGGVANTQRLTGDFYRVFAGCMYKNSESLSRRQSKDEFIIPSFRLRIYQIFADIDSTSEYLYIFAFNVC